MTFTLLRNTPFFSSFFSSYFVLLPSREYNSRVIDEAISEYIFEKRKHSLNILIESGLLAIKNNEKNIDMF